MIKNSYCMIALFSIFSICSYHAHAEKTFTKTFHCPVLHKDDIKYKPTDEFPPGCSKKSIFWTIAEEQYKKKTVYKFKFHSCRFPIKKQLFSEDIGYFEGPGSSTINFDKWWKKVPKVTYIKVIKHSILTKPTTPACFYNIEFKSEGDKPTSFLYQYQLNFIPSPGLKIKKCERDYFKPMFKCRFEETSG